jgi:hypothetical protein
MRTMAKSPSETPTGPEIIDRMTADPSQYSLDRAMQRIMETEPKNLTREQMLEAIKIERQRRAMFIAAKE